jgi:hypothetical protein
VGCWVGFGRGWVVAEGMGGEGYGMGRKMVLRKKKKKKNSERIIILF